MEIAGADGSKVAINPGQTMELGRGHGFNPSDKTISRRQVSFSIPQFDRSRVQFEVLGRNPIYVSKNNEVRILRRFERGEMKRGDMFCVSADNPVWYTLKGFGNCDEGVPRNDLKSELARDFDGGFQQGDIDVSDIDPVTEFGFLVIGREFDLYPKKMIRDVKNLDWFLEEVRRDSDNENDEEKKGKGIVRKKRKKGAENDDDYWRGESEDENVLVNKPQNAQTLKYMTRSKDRDKPGKATVESSAGEKTPDVDDEDEDEETLGGFIVDDENLDEDEGIGEEEEEEFVDEFDEDDE